ncbi:MAG: diguanylate cyclase [Xanthomonadales bacterium]|nr:diguanylate cyclase [Xanthomonadales bacterium]
MAIHGDKDWKSQYRELLRELDAREREWNKLEKALHRALSQVSVAAMGRNEALDASLADLQDVVRGDPDAQEIGGSLKRLKAVLRSAGIGDISEPPGPAGGVSIHELILNLAERIADIPALAPSAEELFYRLATGNADWNRLVADHASSIAQIVSSIQAQKVDLQQFLEQVTLQLSEIDGWTQWQNDSLENRHQDGLDLEASVTSQMQELSDDLDRSEDISELKLKVQARIDHVAEHFRQFREVEQRRYNEAREHNDKLEQQLEKLNKKTRALAKRCGEQEDQLMFDALTRVHSRLAYTRRLKEEFERWQRHGQPLAYSIWDLDKFKSVNDTLGHKAGDRLLQLVGKILNKEKRTEDFIARIGGEEFVMLMPMTDADGAITVVDRIRQVISETPFHFRGDPRQVTVSCGITEFREGDTTDVVYERADQALYQAKNGGRNRCEVL